MLLPLLLSLQPAQPQDAQAVYDRLQQQIKDAGIVSYGFYTGPDAWDSWISLTIEKSGRFSRVQKGYTVYSDGKWTILWGYGKIEHRPTKPSDLNLLYAPGLEVLFPDRLPLDPFGVLEETSGNRQYIQYRHRQDYSNEASRLSIKEGQISRLSLDRTTGLPPDLRLYPPGTSSHVRDVPPAQPQAQVLQKCAQALKPARALLIERETTFSGERPVKEMIYLPGNGTALVAPKDEASFQTVYPDTFVWKAQTTPVPVSKVALRGFEPFTRLPSQTVQGTSYLSGTLAYRNETLYAWHVDPVFPVEGQSVQMKYDEDTCLPDGYTFKKGNITYKTVRYTQLVLNPKMIFAPTSKG